MQTLRCVPCTAGFLWWCRGFYFSDFRRAEARNAAGPSVRANPTIYRRSVCSWMTLVLKQCADTHSKGAPTSLVFIPHIRHPLCYPPPLHWFTSSSAPSSTFYGDDVHTFCFRPFALVCGSQKVFQEGNLPSFIFIVCVSKTDFPWFRGCEQMNQQPLIRYSPVSLFLPFK